MGPESEGESQSQRRGWQWVMKERVAVGLKVRVCPECMSDCGS